MNPFSSHLPPVFSHENDYSNDPYKLNVPFMSRLNFPAITPRSESESLINHMELSSNEAMIIMNDHHHHHEHIVQNGCFGRGKKPVRKDKHSKIYTAQGLRDRRVRLSIGIAREFFDLQDMLGFDKPSKTLEWLLEKSRKEIQELAESKKNSDHKDDDDKGDNDNDQEKSFQSDSSSEYCEEEMVSDASRRKEKQVKRLENRESLNLGEESKRRTRLNENLEKSEHFSKQVTQSQFLNRPAMCPMGGFEQEESLSRPSEDPNIVLQQDIIEESIFIKRKLKSSLIPGYDFSFGSSSGNGNNNNGIVNLSRNWDINHLHSFDDSRAEMNTSQDHVGNFGLNVFGKPW